MVRVLDVISALSASVGLCSLFRAATKCTRHAMIARDASIVSFTWMCARCT